MKRRLSDSVDDDAQPPPSEARKQAKTAQQASPAPWNARHDLAAVAELCGRLSDGTAGANDLYEVVRLVRGAMGGGTARARLSTADGTECAVPLRAYTALWRTLGSNPTAVAAVRQHTTVWPPTFVDVQRAYTAIEPDSAYEHVRQLDLDAVDDPVRAAYELGLAVGVAAERAEKVARLAPGDIEGSVEIFPAAWYDVLDAAGSAFVGACDPGAAYYIVTIRSDAGDKVALFGVQGDDATLVAVVTTPVDRSPLDPEAYESVHIERAPALQAHAAALPLFLRALAYDPREASELAVRARAAGDAEALSALTQAAALLEPIPAGAAQVRRALLPVASKFAVPVSVYDEIARGPPGADDIWFDGDISGAWLDECRLALAVRLFEGQVEARGAGVFLAKRPLSLVDAAAAAYQGPLRLGMAPADVLDWASVYAWQGTCAAPASASGILPDAARLLDVARLWGHYVSRAEARRPDLLCGPLARLSLERVMDANAQQQQ
ncbi:hypothetical protein psal_cds_171 [Pandoravirus salinus]|uniref:Uncharacterized protein n=1 Tax=Pandoravirus salinus TaxID=1349410 RepID=S4VT73_9VIRU|nr:hypothetical protein psal_cds_171 [Pandoravirus salinus]AGO83659.1 hypothetical protein psal_cds_171 [Pandoravirus salinus]